MVHNEASQVSHSIFCHPVARAHLDHRGGRTDAAAGWAGHDGLRRGQRVFALPTNLRMGIPVSLCKQTA